MTPNDHYRGRTAPLTSKRCILYIYSTNIGTEYFKHGLCSPFFPLQNAVCFIILTFGSCIIHILYTGVLKLKKKSGTKRLKKSLTHPNMAKIVIKSNLHGGHLKSWPLHSKEC